MDHADSDECLVIEKYGILKKCRCSHVFVCVFVCFVLSVVNPNVSMRFSAQICIYEHM